MKYAEYQTKHRELRIALSNIREPVRAREGPDTTSFLNDPTYCALDAELGRLYNSACRDYRVSSDCVVRASSTSARRRSSSTAPGARWPTSAGRCASSKSTSGSRSSMSLAPVTFWVIVSRTSTQKPQALLFTDEKTWRSSWERILLDENTHEAQAYVLSSVSPVAYKTTTQAGTKLPLPPRVVERIEGGPDGGPFR